MEKENGETPKNQINEINLDDDPFAGGIKRSASQERVGPSPFSIKKIQNVDTKH